MKTTYTEKLQDPRWQKKRLEVFTAAHWTCSCCASTENQLHVHHRYYIAGRDPWDYPPGCFVCLCNKCHKEETDLQSSPVEAFDTWEEMVSLVVDSPDAGSKKFNVEFERAADEIGVNKDDLLTFLAEVLRTMPRGDDQFRMDIFYSFNSAKVAEAVNIYRNSQAQLQ